MEFYSTVIIHGYRGGLLFALFARGGLLFTPMPKNPRRITDFQGVPPTGKEKPKRAGLKDQRYISEGSLLNTN
jgi:hypothetical protein